MAFLRHIKQGTRHQFLLGVLAIEWLIFIVSGVSFSFLHADPFFSIGVDPLYWLVYATGIPQMILSQQWIGITMDLLISLCAICLVCKPSHNKLAIFLFLLLLLFYLTLTGYHTHRNFQAGFFLVLIPFVFNNNKSREMGYEAVRYFLLFFYISSAILKMFSPALMDPTHFSNILAGQFTPYFLEGNTGWRTNLNLYLISNPGLARILFIAGFTIELSTLAGFFTKRLDRVLAILLLVFHFLNWIIMDIAPFGQIAFICLLFMKDAFKPKAIY